MAKTDFQPEQHGFAFINAFDFDKGEKEDMRKVVSESADGATRTLTANSVPTFGFGDMIKRTVAGWVDNALPDHYGMCGGMAFATADHFRAGLPLPRGAGVREVPTAETPRGKALREYLWQRQMESLHPNAGRLLAWMAMLHIPLPFAGPDWLLDRTREEFAELKGYIDRNEPWPLCLIGSSRSPFDNHQVLAIGYDDPGDGTATLYLYDMNCPGREQTTTLDMRGAELRATESCPSPARGPLRGFFCEQYRPAPPPVLPAE